MIKKYPIYSDRIRKINGSFAFIEHRFLRDGFWDSLNQHGILLYLFLIIVADRNGLSYYSYDKICTLLRMTVDEYILARERLIDQDLIAFDGTLYQVLSLPKSPLRSSPKTINKKKNIKHDFTQIRQILARSLCKNTY